MTYDLKWVILKNVFLNIVPRYDIQITDLASSKNFLNEIIMNFYEVKNITTKIITEMNEKECSVEVFISKILK